MRICLVSHQFVPDNPAGVEIFVHRCARALLELGHEVLVFTTRKDLSRADGSIVEEVYDGVRTKRWIRNLFHEDFRATYDDPRADAAFRREVLDDFRPDVVHAHHLIHLSIGIAEAARLAGIPVFMTLHDYWLECPRMGRLLAWDGGVCERVDHERCGRCLQRFPWRNPPRLKPVARGISLVRRVTGLNLQRPLQHVFRKRQGRRATENAAFDVPDHDAAMEGALAVRQQALRERLVPAVDQFLCPSRFLLERLRAWGIPDEKLVHQPYGVPRPEHFERAERGAGPFRFAYCSSVLPHKGAHVVLDAVEQLRARFPAARAAVSIHGGWASNPDYGAQIERRGQELGVEVTGSYDPSAIDALLSRTDALITPSIWFENQPITILDARVRGIPCLVSDYGAMRELVADEGLRFKVGDGADLARAMALVIEEPTRGVEGEYVPPTPAEDLDKTVRLYGSRCR